MSSAEPRHVERLYELLVDEATEGLAVSSEAELSSLLAEHRDVDREVFQRVAGALAVATTTDFEPMPAALRSRVERHLVDTFYGSEARAEAVSASGLRLAGEAAEPRSEARSSLNPAFAWLGWVAGAAGLLLAATAWMSGVTPAEQSPNAGEWRAQLMSAPETKVVEWQDAEDVGLSGDVVWNDGLQQGFMRFEGLTPNDPAQQQYQLWIFDGSRPTGDLPQFGDPSSILSQRPVDGGVFNVPEGAGEVIVPIRAKLDVGDAVAFAVTVEPPGGVVVSSRERVPALAVVGG